MKSKIIYFVTFISIFLFTACENINHKSSEGSNLNTAKEDSTLTSKIEKLNGILNKAILAGDYDSLLPYYADDITVCPALSPPVKGKAAVEESYRKNRKLGIVYRSFSGIVEELWVCSNKVYERGKFGMSLSSTKHPKPVAYYGSYFTIWQKGTDNSLKIKYVIWNLDFNPYEK